MKCTFPHGEDAEHLADHLCRCLIYCTAPPHDIHCYAMTFTCPCEDCHAGWCLRCETKHDKHSVELNYCEDGAHAYCKRHKKCSALACTRVRKLRKQLVALNERLAEEEQDRKRRRKRRDEYGVHVFSFVAAARDALTRAEEGLEDALGQ